MTMTTRRTVFFTSDFNFVFCSMNRIIFVDVPIGTVGVTIIISFFFNPLIISSIAFTSDGL